jgi:hypothetical protein
MYLNLLGRDFRAPVIQKWFLTAVSAFEVKESKGMSLLVMAVENVWKIPLFDKSLLVIAQLRILVLSNVVDVSATEVGVERTPRSR